MLYVVYTRCADEYEIVTIEDYYQSAVATGNALVNANCDDGTTATDAFIHAVVPDGTEQSTKLERILPDEAPDTIPYELALKLANPGIRIPIPRPVLFTVRDNGLVRCMHYEDGDGAPRRFHHHNHDTRYVWRAKNGAISHPLLNERTCIREYSIRPSYKWTLK
jgi:hypothetical protein